jgi:hypothetical protein
VAIGVCLKAVQGRAARALFADMAASGLVPGKIAYECTTDALEVRKKLRAHNRRLLEAEVWRMWRSYGATKNWVSCLMVHF